MIILNNEENIISFVTFVDKIENKWYILGSCIKNGENVDALVLESRSSIHMEHFLPPKW